MVDFTENFSQYAVSKLPSFRDDFTFHGTQAEADASWASADVSRNRVNIATDVLDLDIIRDDTNDSIVHDLGGIISDSNWVLRFKLQIDTLNQTALQTQGFFGLFDGDETEGEETQQSGIGVILTCITGTLTYRLFSADNELINQGSSTIFNHALAVETIYVEIKRNSITSYEVNLYSDEKFTDLIESQQGISSSGTIDLRYIGVKNNASMTVGSRIRGSMDDVEFWNNGELVIFSDDFATSSNWVQTGSGTTITGGVISGWGADGTDRRLTHDLGSPLSNTNWKAEFEYMFTASNIPAHSPFVISDINQDIDSGTNDNDFLGVSHGTSVNELKIIFGDFIDLGAGSGSTGIPISTSTQYFVRLERLSATQMRLSVYSDSGFTTHIASSPVTVTIPSTIDALQYVHSQNASGGGGSRTLTGTLDNLVISEERTDIREGAVSLEEKFVLGTPQINEDFSTYADQTEADTAWVPNDSAQLRANPTTDVLDFDMLMDGTNDAIALDLGAVISDTEWTLRFKLNMTTQVQGTTGLAVNIGLSNSDQTVGSTTSQDWIGFNYLNNTTFSQWNCASSDNVGISGAGGDGTPVSELLPTSTDIFFELKRTSSTTMLINRYSDSTYTTIIGTSIHSGFSNPTGLRYLKVTNVSLALSAGTGIGTIDDIQFWNGESVLTRWTARTAEGELDTVNRRINWTMLRNGTDNRVVRDLGTPLSNENWTMRFRYHLNAGGVQTTAGGANYQVLLQDTDVGQMSANDTIGWSMQNTLGATGRTFVLFALESGSSSGFATTANAIIPFGGAVDLYVEMKRTSPTTVEARVFNDSSYTDLLAGTELSITTSSANIGHQFLACSSGDDASAWDGTETGFIDCIELYDCSSVAKIPVKELRDFEDKFAFDDQPTADLEWVSTDNTRLRVNITNRNLDFNMNLASTNLAIAHDLGAGNVSNDRWELHAKINFTTLSDDTNTRMYIGLSDSDQTTSMNDITNADRIFMKLDYGFFGSDIKDYTSLDTDGTGEIVADNTIPFTFLTGVDYYLTVVRDSSTRYHVEVFTDPDRTISLGRANGTCTVTTQDLRYIIIQNINATLTTTMTGTIDDVEFWNGKRSLVHKSVWLEVNE